MIWLCTLFSLNRCQTFYLDVHLPSALSNPQLVFAGEIGLQPLLLAFQVQSSRCRTSGRCGMPGSHNACVETRNDENKQQLELGVIAEGLCSEWDVCLAPAPLHESPSHTHGHPAARHSSSRSPLNCRKVLRKGGSFSCRNTWALIARRSFWYFFF